MTHPRGVQPASNPLWQGNADAAGEPLSQGMLQKMCEAILTAPLTVVVPVVSPRGNIVGETEVPVSQAFPALPPKSLP